MNTEMANAMSGLNNNYSVRTYNLTANIPQALPSSRQFMLISATVDLAAIGLSLGSQNADFDSLILGISVGMEEGSIKARIVSTVTQVVVVAMVTGRAEIVDSRFAPSGASMPVTVADGASVSLGARGDAAATTDTGTFSLIALIKRLLGKTTTASATTRSSLSGIAGSAASNTTLVTAGVNVNGVQVVHYSLWCGVDITAVAEIRDSGPLALAYVADSQAVVCAQPFILPAGQALQVQTTGLSRVTIQYVIL